ncbi:MAG: D-glycerate dehydrogenase [Candidatus Binatia bacterium]|nr:MAG: D-glycerate dehydrogenase [Candidatus Binatia bacterium]
MRVLVTRPLPGGVEKKLQGMCTLEVGSPASDRADLLRRIRGASALVCLLTDRIDREVFDAAGPELRLVANMAAGVDNIDLEEARRRGVRVTNTPDVLTEATADLAWALLLACARRVVEGDRFVREGRFHGWEPDLLLGQELFGATLGIVGAGRIGRAVARRASGFGMRVLYTQRHRLPVETEAALGLSYVPLQELLERSDFVSLHCPLTEETYHLLGEEELRKMKPSAVLVNTSRGPVVDERALARVLRERGLFAAGLDVYEREPEVDRALLDLPNVVLLPHLGSATEKTRRKMAELAVEEVLRFCRGEELLHPVV